MEEPTADQEICVMWRAEGVKNCTAKEIGGGSRAYKERELIHECLMSELAWPATQVQFE